jgi:spermidine/putrescine transport system substrate-binding protein
VDRRAFLRSSAIASLGAAGATLLAACGDDPSGTSAAARVVPARPNRPVTLPLHADNPAIEGGLSPESGATLRIFNWEEYIWKKVVDDFAEAYDVDVEVTTFAHMDEALARLGDTNPDAFDVLFHRVDVIGGLVARKLLRPLNHSYIPNLERDVWSVYRNPFYDQGWRYTVPYTVYTTGIAWRTDRVPDDVPALSNPYDIFWDETYRDKIWLMNDYREVIGMALLRNGYTNLNTGSPDQLRAAADDLIQAAELVGGLSIDAFRDLPRGRSWIHQAYSGDMVSAQYYFPKGEDPSVVRYWTAPDGAGAVGNDTIAVLRHGRNPVLAHLFLDYLLGHDVAMKNFSWNGYQPPQRRAEPDRLVAEGYVPSYLASTIVRPEAFNQGFMELELGPRVDARWHRSWDAFREMV